MFITPAYAQAGSGGGTDLMMQLFPFILILVVFYFLLIRPQQKRAQEHKNMVQAVRRGDVVVTAGGLIGKVTKVIDDREIMVELAENVRVKVIKATLTDVRSKTEPADSNNDN